MLSIYDLIKYSPQLNEANIITIPHLIHENLQFSELDISARVGLVHNHFSHLFDLPHLHPTIQRDGSPGYMSVPPNSVG